MTRMPLTSWFRLLAASISSPFRPPVTSRKFPSRSPTWMFVCLTRASLIDDVDRCDTCQHHNRLFRDGHDALVLLRQDGALLTKKPGRNLRERIVDHDFHREGSGRLVDRRTDVGDPAGKDFVRIGFDTEPDRQTGLDERGVLFLDRTLEFQ